MRVNHTFFKRTGCLLFAAGLLLQACNKDLPEAVPLTPAKSTATETILQKLNAPEFSILKTAIEKASTFASTTGKLTDLLGNANGEFTFFAPDNTAILTSFSLLGLPADANSLNFFRAGQLDSMLKYHLIGGQTLTANKITDVFPNMYLQSSLVLAPPSAALPPGLRMPIFLDKAGSANFVNNVPITAPDIAVSNGVMHKIGVALLPPAQVLYQRIATDPNLTYLKAAIARADSLAKPENYATATTETDSLTVYLRRPEVNFTVFAPTDDAFKATLFALARPSVWNAIYQQAILQGASPAMATAAADAQATPQTNALVGSPAVFSNPLLFPVLTAERVKGVVVYHMLASRAFLNNFPTTQTNYPTLLNGQLTTHPGVGLQAAFGTSGVTAATVKGFINVTPANITINPLPGTGTSDQNCVNGVLHKIDQVLLPLSF